MSVWDALGQGISQGAQNFGQGLSGGLSAIGRAHEQAAMIALQERLRAQEQARLEERARRASQFQIAGKLAENPLTDPATIAAFGEVAGVDGDAGLPAFDPSSLVEKYQRAEAAKRSAVQSGDAADMAQALQLQNQTRGAISAAEAERLVARGAQVIRLLDDHARRNPNTTKGEMEPYRAMLANRYGISLAMVPVYDPEKRLTMQQQQPLIEARTAAAKASASQSYAAAARARRETENATPFAKKRTPEETVEMNAAKFRGNPAALLQAIADAFGPEQAARMAGVIRTATRDPKAEGLARGKREEFAAAKDRAIIGAAGQAARTWNPDATINALPGAVRALSDAIRPSGDPLAGVIEETRYAINNGQPVEDAINDLTAAGYTPQETLRVRQALAGF